MKAGGTLRHKDLLAHGRLRAVVVQQVRTRRASASYGQVVEPVIWFGAKLVLSAVGIRIGEADIVVTGATCGRPVLVQ